MHPKAATLALAGYTLVVFMFGNSEPSNTIRVVHRGQPKYGETISYCTLHRPARRWNFDQANMPADAYADIDWGFIPDDDWGTLPDWMIAKAIQGA